MTNTRQSSPASGQGKNTPISNFLAWALAVAGWLLCSAMCLWLTIALEPWPMAYDMLFPAVILVLFGNIFLFLLVATRWAASLRKLANSVMRLCLGEGLLLGGLYLLGRFCMGD